MSSDSDVDGEDPEEVEFKQRVDKITRLVFPILDKVKAKYKGKSMKGHCTCPLCKGVLRITHTAYNGHVNAFCDTEGCVRLME